MSYSYTPNQINRVRSIPLSSVLHFVGAERDNADKARWNTAMGAISVTGTKFFNWNCGIGGGGAIDMVIHLCGLDFKDAVTWLSKRFPECEMAGPLREPSKSELKLPVPVPCNLAAVKHYLIVERRIPHVLIEHLILTDNLYADRRANAVFLARGEYNTPVGAELRGTGRYTWRGMAPGSRKERGYFSAHDCHTNDVIICESAIDAISCLVIHPGHCCISTAGARSTPAWLHLVLSRHAHVYCGFDADPTGDAMAHAMIQAHPSIKRLRPSQHDWNDLLRSRS